MWQPQLQLVDKLNFALVVSNDDGVFEMQLMVGISGQRSWHTWLWFLRLPFVENCKCNSGCNLERDVISYLAKN